MPTRDEIEEEIATILASDFDIEITRTSNVPHADDPAITFPNLDLRFQRCKIIETAVLYVDIRGSTSLNQDHRTPTVAKLYSAFVRAVTGCAEEHGGHVRGIIGDRVMVLFDPSTAFTDAVDTATFMNSVCQDELRTYFRQDDVTCGIGIDYGRMLATKTGMRRHGYERHNYRSLVWLGRPANVASKLTDLANKTTHHSWDIVHEATAALPPVLGLVNALSPSGLAQALIGATGSPHPLLCPFGLGQAPGGEWVWKQMELKEFVGRLTYDPVASTFTHRDPSFRHFFLSTSQRTTTTPPILMTKAVYDGFRRANPQRDSVLGGWWKPVSLSVPGYNGAIFGGDVIFPK